MFNINLDFGRINKLFYYIFQKTDFMTRVCHSLRECKDMINAMLVLSKELNISNLAIRLNICLNQSRLPKNEKAKGISRRMLLKPFVILRTG